MRFVCILTFFAALSLGSNASAQDSDVQAALDAACLNIGNLAEVIMQKRQDGTALSAMMAVLAKMAPDTAKLARPMVQEAFRQPRLSLPENQKRLIADFRSQNELTCYNTFQAQADAIIAQQKKN